MLSLSGSNYSTTLSLPPASAAAKGPAIYPLIEPLTTEKSLKMTLSVMQEACLRLPSTYQSQVLSEIQTWEKLFFQTYLCDSADPSEKIKTSLALATLGFRLVEEVFLTIAGNADEQVVWLNFQDELKDLIQKNLPDNISLDNFIIRFKHNEAKVRQIPQIQSLLSQIQEEFYERAELINSTLIAIFEECKIELIDLQEGRANATASWSANLSALAVKVSKLYASFKTTLDSEDRQVIVNHLKEQADVIDSLAARCEHILTKM